MKRFLLILPFLLLTSASHAERAMPSKEVEKLYRLFLGQYKAKVNIKHPDGTSDKQLGEMTCSKVADDFGILCVLDAEPSQGDVQELWLVSYEEATHTPHFFIVEGESSHDHVGKWLDENTLQLTKAPEKSGCNMIELTFKRRDDKHLILTGREASKAHGEEQIEISYESTKEKHYPESAGKEKSSETIRKIDDILLGQWSLEEHVTLPDGSKKNDEAQMKCFHVGAGFGINCLIDWEKKSGLAQEYWLIGHDKTNSTVHMFVIVGKSAHDHVAHLNEKGELEISRSCITTPCPTERMTLKRLDSKKSVLEGSAPDAKGQARFKFEL